MLGSAVVVVAAVAVVVAAVAVVVAAVAFVASVTVAIRDSHLIPPHSSSAAAETTECLAPVVAAASEATAFGKFGVTMCIDVD